MHDIRIDTIGDKIHVACPYNKKAISAFRDLDGKWNSLDRVWRFAAQELNAVREALVEHYGHDDRPVETVDVRVNLGGWGVCRDREFRLFNRKIAWRPGRDTRVRLGNNVVLAEGSFHPSAGSRNNPQVGDMEGVVVLVRNVPDYLVDESGEDVRIVPREPASTPSELLLTERRELEEQAKAVLARITEIDTILAQQSS